MNKLPIGTQIDELGRISTGGFAQDREEVGSLSEEFRHLPGKHNQKDHAKKSAKTPPTAPNDITSVVSDKMRDGNAENGLVSQSSHDFSDPRDHQLTAISKLQGFDAKPTKGSVDDIVTNGGTEIHRGIIPFKGSNTVPGRSADDIEKEFTDGKYEPGTGNYGNGYYFSTSPGIAKMYSGAPIVSGGYNAKKVEGGKTLRAALKPDAKVVDYDQLEGMQKAWRDKHRDNVDWDTMMKDFKADPGKMNPSMWLMIGDPGRFAAMMGFDAIRVPLKDRPSDRRNASRIKKKIGNDDLGDEIVVLNRGMVVVE